MIVTLCDRCKEPRDVVECWGLLDLCEECRDSFTHWFGMPRRVAGQRAIAARTNGQARLMGVRPVSAPIREPATSSKASEGR